MRRPARRLFAVCAALSLMLAMGLAARWAYEKAGRAGGDVFRSFAAPGGTRYTLSATWGRLTLYAPPPLPPARPPSPGRGRGETVG